MSKQKLTHIPSPAPESKSTTDKCRNREEHCTAPERMSEDRKAYGLAVKPSPYATVLAATAMMTL